MDTEKHIKVGFNTDEDGYISQECPACKKRFKVNFSSGSDEPISYCPYCGHKERDCWWTQKQVDYLSGVVGKELIGPELDKMAKDFNRKARVGNFINMTMSVKHSSDAPEPKEPSEPMPIVTFECCGEKTKHDQSQKALFCIICGKEKECSVGGDQE